MKSPLAIGIIGDFDPDRESHLATSEALGHAAAFIGVGLNVSWVATPEIGAGRSERKLASFDGLFCSPGTCASMAGALEGIRFAREHRRPFLGT